MTHPELWYIAVTNENYEELNSWWWKKAEKSGWLYESKFHMTTGCLLLSKHPEDTSYYWSSLQGFSEKNPSYQKITLEQFREIIKSNP